jgi:hypothetical protein
MSLTIGELRKAIADLPDDASLMLVFEGALRHAAGITVAPNGEVAVIRTQGNSRQSAKFSVVEDGLIGGMDAMGMSNEYRGLATIRWKLGHFSSSVLTRALILGADYTQARAFFDPDSACSCQSG